MRAYTLADLTLARRLEAAEGRANAAFVDARARLAPALGASWREVAGTLAMFDGAASPLTQTFGLGLHAPVTDAGLHELEAFFAERGAPVAHEVSPLADLAHLALLPARGYRPVEFTAVLHQPLDAGDPRPVPSGITARLVGGDEAEAWAATAAGGWGESPEVAAFMLDFGAVTARSAGTHCFVAESDGAAVGTGAVALHGGVALLAGASTLPEWRGRGAQAALLDARLRHAAAHGCDIAMLAALPGSASQRNAERRGFRIAYTRLKWVRERG